MHFRKKQQKNPANAGFLKAGAPEKIRTPNLLIRSQMLYPIELRALRNVCVITAFRI